MNQLKLATRDRHVALERQLPLLDPALSLRDYRQCLARFLGYFAPLEQALLGQTGWDAIGFDYADRLKTPRLALDLLALGATPKAVAALPQCQRLPPVDSLPSLLGCLYVIEGAGLGGQVITRHLRASLGLTPATGGAFFFGDGELTGPRWKAFVQDLKRQVAEQGGGDAVIASANLTFATLDDWLFAPALPARLAA